MNQPRNLCYPLFDGERVYEAATVVIENGRISAVKPGTAGDKGGDGFLMPGLMDGHTHLIGKKPMDRLLGSGVTTTCAVGVPESVARQSDYLKIHTSRTMALGNIADGKAYVLEELRSGADYIKVILEAPARMAPKTMEAEVLRDIVRYAHDHGVKVAAHAVTLPMTRMAVEAGVDILIHVPMTEAFPPALAEQIARQGMAIVPTLTMMEAFSRDIRFLHYRPEHYPNAERAVRLLHDMGVPILAGTDANDVPFVPKVTHGTSLHHELALLVRAGLTPVEALRGATSRMAAVFGLKNTGTIAPGYAADLVLVAGRPDQNITDSENIRQVWVDGTPIL